MTIASINVAMIDAEESGLLLPRSREEQCVMHSLETRSSSVDLLNFFSRPFGRGIVPC